jgi:polyhydroxybutyrate depolymerase
VVLTGCRWFPGGRPFASHTPPVRSAGCAAATPRAPGLETVATTSDGVARTYLRRVPAGYDPRSPVPVVVDIHGYAEGAAIHVAMSEMGPIADANRFIVVYPQALRSPPAWDTRIGGPDLAYVGQVMDEIERDVCVDRRRVFVQGLSMGAFMTSAIACRFADRVAAVGLVAGIRDPQGCAPSLSVPAVAFHGTEDPLVPFAPIPGYVAAWAGRNRCVTDHPIESRVAADVALIRYLCPAGSEVGLYRVDGGGHAWPGSEFSRQIEAVVGFTTFSIDASQIMWDFFRHHPLPRFALAR